MMNGPTENCRRHLRPLIFRPFICVHITASADVPFRRNSLRVSFNSFMLNFELYCFSTILYSISTNPNLQLPPPSEGLTALLCEAKASVVASNAHPRCPSSRGRVTSCIQLPPYGGGLGWGRPSRLKPYSLLKRESFIAPLVRGTAAAHRP